MSKRQLEELKKLLELNETLEDTLEKMSLMYTHLEDIGREEGQRRRQYINMEPGLPRYE